MIKHTLTAVQNKPAQLRLIALATTDTNTGAKSLSQMILHLLHLMIRLSFVGMRFPWGGLVSRLTNNHFLFVDMEYLGR